MPSFYTRGMTDLNSCPNPSLKCNTAVGENNSTQPSQVVSGRQPDGAYIGLAIVLVLMLLAFVGWLGFGGGSRYFARLWARIRGNGRPENTKDSTVPPRCSSPEDAEKGRPDAFQRESSDCIKKTESSGDDTFGNRLPSMPQETLSPPTEKTRSA